MIAKIRELNLDDVKAVSGGVTIPTKQQVIANSATMNMTMSMPSGVNTALAKPTLSSSLLVSSIR
ncbi:MAG: hypothetical protein K2X72_09900 [Reyranella sp.]|nr:hypothetical protein [Reyranella sp.]